MNNIKLLCCIVNLNKGSKVLSIGKKAGVNGGTIFHGHGTISNKFLNFMGIYDEAKDIVIMATSNEISKKGLDLISKEMKFEKKGNGIGFIIPLNNIYGNLCLSKEKNIEKIVTEDKKEEDKMYQSIVVIVDRGLGDEVVESSKKAGARGATIIHGRGSGIHETQKIFAMPIEPEKEIILIITKKESSKAIIESINKNLEIEKPGKGILFVHDLDTVTGLYE